MTLFGLIVLLLIVGVVLALVPMDPTIRRVVIIVVVIVLVIVLIRALGGPGIFGGPRL